MASFVVEFKNVSKNYGSLPALRNISFAVEKGSFFGLLGPNGAGKSTLINSMSGLVTPSAGDIYINGHHTIANYRHARTNLGLVPQELIADPFFTIKELLEIQSGYFGLKGKNQQGWVDELLERLALTDKAGSLTHTLSGGMKRRVLIAMALVHKPDVIVLDEPTAGVDVELRKTLWQFTKELHAKGHTIILTTHYLEEAEALCEKIAILDKGQLKALETTANLLSKHNFRYIRVSLHLGVDAVKTLLKPELQSRIETINSTELVFKVEKELPLNKMLAWLAESGLELKDVSSRDATLEEVFLDITGEASS